MNREAYIAARERINEMRAQQRGLSLKEAEAAAQIQEWIKQEKDLEETILQWELFAASLKADKRSEMEQADSLWDKLRKRAGI